MAKPNNPQEKIAYRVQLFSDAIRGTKMPERCPHVNDFWTWKIWASGNKLSEVLYDSPKYVDVMRYMLENYEFDVYTDTGGRNPLAVARVLGSDEYILDDEKCSINVKEQCFMEADDYDEILRLGYHKFMYTKIVPKRAKNAQQLPNMPVIYDAAKELKNFQDMNQQVAALLTEYGVPAKQSLSIPQVAIEALMNFTRGIKGLSLDLRRNYDKVCEVCDELDATVFRFDEETFAASATGKFDGQTPGCAFDMFYSILAHSILNPKKFERLMWPRIKKIGELAEKHDKTVYMHNEGNSEHLYDFLRDLPANRFTFAIEQNDIFRMKRELPNIIPQGGMLTSVLSSCTPEQVVDYAKMLIEKVGYDGRFIMAPDKMISFASDCSQENLHALCDFMEDFRY